MKVLAQVASKIPTKEDVARAARITVRAPFVTAGWLAGRTVKLIKDGYDEGRNDYPF